jgi:hypothetical protein
MELQISSGVRALPGGCYISGATELSRRFQIDFVMTLLPLQPYPLYIPTGVLSNIDPPVWLRSGASPRFSLVLLQLFVPLSLALHGYRYPYPINRLICPDKVVP